MRGHSPREAEIQWGGQGPNSSLCSVHCPDRAELGLAAAGINSCYLGSIKSFSSTKQSSSAPSNPEQAWFNLVKIEDFSQEMKFPPETFVTVLWV